MQPIYHLLYLYYIQVIYVSILVHDMNNVRERNLVYLSNVFFHILEPTFDNLRYRYRKVKAVKISTSRNAHGDYEALDKLPFLTN